MIDILHQKPLLGRQINWAHPLAKGLVACWVFNEGSGNKVYDIASHRYDLDFVNGPVWSPGENGHSVLFDDGDSEYLGRGDGLGFTDWPITISCWFNSDAALNQSLMTIGDLDASNDIELRLRDPADSDIIIYIEDQGGGLEFAGTSSNWSLNTLHHACGVIESDVKRSVYLDAGNKGTDIDNIGWPTGVDNTTIGATRYASTISQHMSGRIDLPMVWNRALTDDEVEWIYREPYAMFQQNRVRWFSIPAVVGDGQAFRLRAIEKY